MSLREKGKERRKQRILDAAVSVLRDKGPESLVTALIAERAEVSVATLYNLVGSVDDILDAITERLTEESQRLTAPDIVADNLLTILESEVSAVCEYLADDEESKKAVMRAIYRLNVSRGWSPSVKEAALSDRDKYTAWIKQAVKVQALEGVKPRLLAEQIITANNMLMENWSVSIISLERYRISALMHFLALLHPWAVGDFQHEVFQHLQLLQQDVLKLERREQRKRKNTA